MSKYKGIICRGSYLLGSACGHCERCKDEMESLRQAGKLPEKDPQNLPKADAYSLLAEVRAWLRQNAREPHDMYVDEQVVSVDELDNFLFKYISEHFS